MIKKRNLADERARKKTVIVSAYIDIRKAMILIISLKSNLKRQQLFQAVALSAACRIVSIGIGTY